MRTEVITAHPAETLRMIADRMLSTNVEAMPVVDPADPRLLRGLVTEFNLFRARGRMLEEERHREQVLRLRPIRARRDPPSPPAGRLDMSGDGEDPAVDGERTARRP
jgi:CBS-domain-containing membrane protein